MIDSEKLKAALLDPYQSVYYHGDINSDLIQIINEWEAGKEGPDLDDLEQFLDKSYEEVQDAAANLEDAVNNDEVSHDDLIELIKSETLPELRKAEGHIKQAKEL